MKTRSIIAVFLVVLLVFAIPFSSYAIDEEKTDGEKGRGCIHDWRFLYYVGTTISNGPETCSGDVAEFYICNNCGATSTGTVSYHSIPHSFTGINSSCNGSVQTLNYRCRNCGYLKVVTRPCPNAPHSGPCGLLPFGYIHHEPF